MKRFLLLLSFLIPATIQQISAQLCTPDPAYTQPGVYPDTSVNLNSGCVGNFYFQDFTIVVPPDTTIFGLNFTINWFRIDSVGGMPPGLTIACNPGTCSINGGTRGCLNLYGTPATAGTYPMIVYITGQATHPFFGTQLVPLTFSGYEISVGQAPSLTSGFTPSSCVINNGMAWANATGPSTYTYQWNTNPTSSNDSVFNLAPGIYVVTASDPLGCNISDTLNVSTVSGPTVDSVTATNVTCSGAGNGSAIAYVSGGTPGYTFSWSNGGNNPSVSNLAPGTYTVTVQDQGGCQASSLVTITQPFPLSPGTSSTGLSCFGSADGTASSIPSGGTFPFSYSWSNGGNTQMISNLAAGTYTVTVTDNNNCTVSGTTTLTQPVAISSNPVFTDVSCFGGTDGEITVAPSGGVPAYTFSWSNGDTAATISGLTAMAYQVIITDASGCTATQSVLLTQPTPLSLVITPQFAGCSGEPGGAITTFIGGGTSPYQYLWNTGAVSSSLAGLNAGTYSLTVTDTNGCTIADTVDVTAPLPIVISLVATHESSVGSLDGAIDATVSGGVSPYTFDWNNGGTTEDLSGLPAGTYILEVTDDNGCVISDTVVVFNLAGVDGTDDADWKLFPNPVVDILNIQGENFDELRICDLSGRVLIVKRNVTPPLLFTMENFTSGLYIVQVFRGENLYHYPIIKR